MYYTEKDPAIKENFKKIACEKLPYYLDKFEEQVKKNGGHFVGGRVTIFGRQCTQQILTD